MLKYYNNNDIYSSIIIYKCMTVMYAVKQYLYLITVIFIMEKIIIVIKI